MKKIFFLSFFTIHFSIHCMLQPYKFGKKNAEMAFQQFQLSYANEYFALNEHEAIEEHKNGDDCEFDIYGLQEPRENDDMQEDITPQKKLAFPCSYPACHQKIRANNLHNLTVGVLKHLHSESHNPAKHAQAKKDYKPRKSVLGGFSTTCTLCGTTMNRRTVGPLLEAYKLHIYCTQKHNPDGYNKVETYVQKKAKKQI
jgi:hypothetical protein